MSLKTYCLRQVRHSTRSGKVPQTVVILAVQHGDKVSSQSSVSEHGCPDLSEDLFRSWKNSPAFAASGDDLAEDSLSRAS
jgi:hypothetical protein